MIDRAEMFCLAGLIEPNLERNHGRLYGKCRTLYLPNHFEDTTADKRKHNTIGQLDLQASITPSAFKRICPPIVLANSSVLPSFWSSIFLMQPRPTNTRRGIHQLFGTGPIFLDSFEDFATNLRKRKKHAAWLIDFHFRGATDRHRRRSISAPSSHLLFFLIFFSNPLLKVIHLDVESKSMARAGLRVKGLCSAYRT